MGQEDEILLPPPPKKVVAESSSDSELLPPPVKKKISDIGGTSSGGTSSDTASPYQYQWSDSKPLKTASIAPHPEVPKTKVQTVVAHTSQAAMQNPNLYVSSPNAKANREQYISSLSLTQEEKDMILHIKTLIFYGISSFYWLRNSAIKKF